MVDAFIAYKFIKILAVPFEKTDAFKLGIIDKDGKILKKRKDLKTGEEKKAYTIIHTLVWKIKKILIKLQIGKSRIGSLAAAMWFLREEFKKLDADPQLVEDGVLQCLDMFDIDINEFKQQMLKESFENEDTVPKGIYALDGELIMISEDLESFDSVLDVPLFFINIDGKKCVFSKDELKDFDDHERL